MKNFIKFNYNFVNTKQIWLKKKEKDKLFLPFLQERNKLGILMNSSKELKGKNLKNKKKKKDLNKFSKNHWKNLLNNENDKHIKKDDFLYNKEDLLKLEEKKLSNLKNNSIINRSKSRQSINFSGKHWIINDIKKKCLYKIKYNSLSKPLLIKKHKHHVNDNFYNWDSSINYIKKQQPSYSFKRQKFNHIRFPKSSNISLKSKTNDTNIIKRSNLVNYLTNIAKTNIFNPLKKKNTLKKKKNWKELEEFLLYKKINNKFTNLTSSLEKIRKIIKL